MQKRTYEKGQTEIRLLRRIKQIIENTTAETDQEALIAKIEHADGETLLTPLEKEILTLDPNQKFTIALRH